MAYNKKPAHNFKDITGQRFGRLVVVERAEQNQGRKAMWECVCDCGKQTVVRGTNLNSGHTTSCGCLSDERIAKLNFSHGKRRTRLYRIWSSMKTRCYNPKDEHYARYGGRGITVCDAWRNDFQAFYDWAIANGYDENAAYGKCTIDRIDNDKGYYPDNCRWADMKTQNNNKSTKRKVKINGC